MMRFIFMGSPDAAVPSLDALCASQHQLVGVVTRPDRPAGRGQRMTPCAVAARARALNLPLFQPESLKQPPLAETIKELDVDLAIVVAYGKILPPPVLDAPVQRCWNVHFSLLPQYRGASPVQAALIAGETVTGVSIIELIDKLDAGPILNQAEYPIRPEQSAAHLQEELARLGADLLLETLGQLEAGRLKRRLQDNAQASLAPLLTKEDGHLDWTRPATALGNQIRGMNPWPGAFTFIDRVRLKIYSAEALNAATPGTPGSIDAQALPEQLIVRCGQGCLRLDEIQLEGKKRMSARELLRGHRLPATTRFI